jgi:biopolymer transport protein ExbD
MQGSIDGVVGQVKQIKTRPAVDHSIQLSVGPAGSFRIDEGRPQRLAVLKKVIQDRARLAKKAKVNPASVTVHVSVDDVAPFSSFDQVVKVCRKCGFFKFELAIAADEFSFDFTPLDELDPDELHLELLTLRLRARDDGSLADLILNDHRIGDIADLQSLLIEVIGSERGPGSIQESLELEIDCDQDLKFIHLATACQAATGYKDSDGSRVALVKRIWPVMGRLSKETEKIEVIEEVRLEPLFFRSKTTRTSFIASFPKSRFTSRRKRFRRRRLCIRRKAPS